MFLPDRFIDHDKPESMYKYAGLDSLNIEFIGILILTERASERSCVPTSEGRHITKYGSKTCGKFGAGGCNCGYETLKNDNFNSFLASFYLHHL